MMSKLLGAIASLVVVLALAFAWSGAAFSMDSEPSGEAALARTLLSTEDDEDDADENADDDDAITVTRNGNCHRRHDRDGDRHGRRNIFDGD